MLIEVKSCTLFGRKIAMFPDAPSLRAVKHLQGMRNKQKEMAAGILLLCNQEIQFFIPDFHIDYEFATKLYHTQIKTSDSKTGSQSIKSCWSSDFLLVGRCGNSHMERCGTRSWEYY